MSDEGDRLRRLAADAEDERERDALLDSAAEADRVSLAGHGGSRLGLTPGSHEARRV